MDLTARRLAACAVAVVALLASCSSDDGGRGTSSAKVLTFEVGDAMCTADSGAVKVTWTTEDATSVEFAVDGEAPGASAGFGPSGETTLDIPCSGGASTISITPFNDDGAGETVDKQVGG